jgi:glycerol kinase
MPQIPQYILALDQGTTSSRALVFDSAGKVISLARKELSQFYPQPGWVEQDPMEIWSGQSAVAIEALSRVNLKPRDIAAIGITNQRETVVVWERASGRPIHRAIVWQDRRTANTCSEMKQSGVEKAVTEKTGLRLDPYFSASKIAWILDNVSGARRRAEAGELLCGTVDSWLVYQLTAGNLHITDVSNASRTLLCNIDSGEWDDELLELFKIPRAMLPAIQSSAEVYGQVAEGHFAAGVPIAGIAGDQHAALFGQACFDTGKVKSTYGTGCFLVANTGSQRIRSQNNLLTSIAWRIGNKTEYTLEGSVFIAGALFQWLRDALKMVQDVRELDQLAASVSDSAGLVIVPAFAGLGAPHWDPYARGVALGITRGTNRAHFCRAAIEAVALQCAELIACMQQDRGFALTELRVDGGAAHSQPLMQLQADLLDVPVVRPHCIETTALGAAYLAGLGVGMWPDRNAIASQWQADKIFSPNPDSERLDALRRQWQEALQHAIGWGRGAIANRC